MSIILSSISLRAAIFALSALGFAAGGCGQATPCEELAKRLCDTASEHCDEARSWVAGQGVGDAGERDRTCAIVLEDQAALSGYVTRFAAALAPAPVVVAEPVAPSVAAAPPREPTTREKVKEVGATLEELGNATEKAGVALDKLGGALGADAR